MSRSQILVSAGVLFLLVSVLTACSSSATPRQIANYPLSTPYYQSGLIRTHDTYLELEVSNVDKAVERVIQLAYQFNGMVIESSSWQQGRCKHATLVVVAPIARSPALRLALLQLGTLLWEQTDHRMIDLLDEGSRAYPSHTVHLMARCDILSAATQAGWRPTHTLARAWSVFVMIFRFLGDIFIWISVVIGPFVLIGLVIWVIIRRH